MHCNGCMAVAWDMVWGGSRSTKPCIFPCEMAAAGDEGYLVRNFAAESHESYWSGRIKVAMVISQLIFSVLGLEIFLLEFL